MRNSLYTITLGVLKEVPPLILCVCEWPWCSECHTHTHTCTAGNGSVPRERYSDCNALTRLSGRLPLTSAPRAAASRACEERKKKKKDRAASHDFVVLTLFVRTLQSTSHRQTHNSCARHSTCSSAYVSAEKESSKCRLQTVLKILTPPNTDSMYACSLWQPGAL